MSEEVNVTASGGQAAGRDIVNEAPRNTTTIHQTINADVSREPRLVGAGVERADMAIRLVEERARCGYSQAGFAGQLEIGREVLRHYELGQREIGTELLARAAALGVDVQYVLTGIRSMNVWEAEQAARPAIQAPPRASGNVVHFMNGGTVTQITTARHVTKTVAKVDVGGQHISPEQQAKLTALVKDVVELEERLKKAPKGYQAVWGALNAHCKVARYVLIAATDYGKAEKYLRQWIGRLNSMASAPVTDNAAWRQGRYAYIKINTKGEETWLAAYLKKTYKVESIADLPDDDLDRTYRAVASRKRGRARSPKGA